MKRLTIRLITSLGLLTLYNLFYLQIIGIFIGFAVATALPNTENTLCSKDVKVEAIIPTINFGCYLGK